MTHDFGGGILRLQNTEERKKIIKTGRKRITTQEQQSDWLYIIQANNRGR